VLALLSRGTGPLAESDAPYPDYVDLIDHGAWKAYVPDPAPPTGPAQFRLKNAYYFRDEPETIKAALMEFGGLAFAYLNSDDTKSDKDGHIYTPTPHPPSHGVLLVGWDDEHPIASFDALPHQPSRPGAWKIQNSWGTEKGQKGFYWISYEDQTIFGRGSEATLFLPVAFEMESPNAYDEIYFHDPLGMSGALSFGKAESFTVANAFTAKRNEKIVSVGFMTAQDGLDYEIQLYRGIPAGQSPGAGEPVFAAPVPRHVKDGVGYVTVKLPSPVEIEQGERFAAAVTFKSKIAARDGETFSGLYAPVEAKLESTHTEATLNAGESYFLREGDRWGDIYEETLSEDKGNFCVKALTVPSESGGKGGCAGLGSGVGFLALPAGGALLIKMTKTFPKKEAR
jgi:hypothetical protein